MPADQQQEPLPTKYYTRSLFDSKADLGNDPCFAVIMADDFDAWNTRPEAAAPQPSVNEVKREGWLTREQALEEKLYIEAHDAPNHAMPRDRALALCRMALAAIDKGDK